MRNEFNLIAGMGVLLYRVPKMKKNSLALCIRCHSLYHSGHRCRPLHKASMSEYVLVGVARGGM